MNLDAAKYDTGTKQRITVDSISGQNTDFAKGAKSVMKYLTLAVTALPVVFTTVVLAAATLPVIFTTVVFLGVASSGDLSGSLSQVLLG